MGARPKPFLFIANGNGGDSIAAEIIRRLPRGARAEAFPMVGNGKPYAGLCKVVGPRALVPSEGWRHTSGSLARDVKGGLLGAILPARNFLKSAVGQYAKVIAVGDGVGPLLCWTAGLPIDIYLDVFKSGYAHRYNFIERELLRRTTKTVFCRDKMLAATLREVGVDGV